MAAIVGAMLLGSAVPAQAESVAYRADSASCAKAKKKVKKAKKNVRAAKAEGGTKLQRAKRALKKAKKAKRKACAGSGSASGSDSGSDSGSCRQRFRCAAAFPWQEGRYQGTYAENNVDLAFNVVETRLFTGPFDGFYLQATCRNVDPDYTGPDQVYTDSNVFEPVEATIAPSGSFAGEGTYHTGSTPPMDWSISGQIAGTNVTDGKFSATYTDVYGNPCSGTTHFTAAWYGDYTL